MFRLIKRVVLYIRTNFLGYRQEGIDWGKGPDWDAIIAYSALQLKNQIDKDILEKIYYASHLERERERWSHLVGNWTERS
jgi:hypothetical protein